MKNKFNYLLKTVFLSFVVLFISCETQEEVVSNSNRDIKKTHITLKELSSKPNAVSKIQEFKTKKSNMDSGKLVYNEEYDFFIDDQNMLLIEEGSKHWITIPIYRKKPNANLENLILKPDENGLYKSFLASYQLTDQDRINIKNGIPVLDLDVKTDLYALDGKYVGQLYDLGNGDCGYVNHINQITSSTIEVTFVLAPCNGTQIQYGYTENVPSNTTGGASGYVPSGYTPNFNGGNGGVGSFPTGNGSNGTQQTSGNSNTNNNILTEPTISFEETQIKKFIKSLSTEQHDFFFPEIDSTNIAEHINDFNIVEYMIENGVEDENQNFVIDIYNSNENNSLVSAKPFYKYPIGSNYDSLYPNFTSLLIDYLPNMANPQMVNIISQLTGESNQKITKDLQWGFGAEIQILQLGTHPTAGEIKGKFDPNNPNVIQIDIDLVNLYESNESYTDASPLQSLILFSVLLHELVHYEDFNFDSIMINSIELGEYFEQLYLGGMYEFNPNGDGSIIFIKP